MVSRVLISPEHVAGMDAAVRISFGGLTRGSRWHAAAFWLMGPDVARDFDFPPHPHHKGIIPHGDGEVAFVETGFPGQPDVKGKQQRGRC